MRDYKIETEKRVEFIKSMLSESGAEGIVFANSGGKDCALAGILCKMACENTVGLILPCESKRNFTSDADDARELADMFGIETRAIDLTDIKALFAEKAGRITGLNKTTLMNIAPRLRMISLYIIAASEKRLVAGTGNRSEIYMGYFTKWGDGAYDFNPIADLTATEVFEYLRYLGAPKSVIEKAPSAGLFEGQTDEEDMGVSYAAIDGFLLGGEISEEDKKIVDSYHNSSGHKRKMPTIYKGRDVVNE